MIGSACTVAPSLSSYRLRPSRGVLESIFVEVEFLRLLSSESRAMIGRLAMVPAAERGDEVLAALRSTG